MQRVYLLRGDLLIQIQKSQSMQSTPDLPNGISMGIAQFGMSEDRRGSESVDIGGAISKFEFPDAASDYIGEMFEGLDVLITHNLANVIMDKTVPKSIAIKKKYEYEQYSKNRIVLTPVAEP